MIILQKYFEIPGWNEQQKDKEKVLAPWANVWCTLKQYIM